MRCARYASAHRWRDLYYAAQELDIRQSAADSAREQLRRVNAQIEVGKQPPSAAAEVEVAARGARTAARQGLRKAQLTEEDVRNQLAAAVARLCVSARTARQRADVLAGSMDAAALDLAAERARFEVGRSTNFDVLRRQEEVAQVQLGQARARVDEVKAVAALHGPKLCPRHHLGTRGPGSASAAA